jgi:hypothetical protein
VGLRATIGVKSSEVMIRDEVTSLIRGNRAWKEGRNLR